jgi:hypothetical protein
MNSMNMSLSQRRLISFQNTRLGPGGTVGLRITEVMMADAQGKPEIFPFPFRE